MLLHLSKRLNGSRTPASVRKLPNVGARLRAMGHPWESLIARERAPTFSPYGCTTVIVAGVLRPTPRSSGRYMSSTSDGGTVYVPGETARTR